MLSGACLDGLVTAMAPPALPMGLVAALAKAQAGMTAAPSNDACDICKVSDCDPLDTYHESLLHLP